jgi:hypothetical protein
MKGVFTLSVYTGVCIGEISSPSGEGTRDGWSRLSNSSGSACGFGLVSGFTAHSAELKNFRTPRSSRELVDIGRFPKFGRRTGAASENVFGELGAGGPSVVASKAALGIKCDIGTFRQIEVQSRIGTQIVAKLWSCCRCKQVNFFIKSVR